MFNGTGEMRECKGILEWIGINLNSLNSGFQGLINSKSVEFDLIYLTASTVFSYKNPSEGLRGHGKVSSVVECPVLAIGGIETIDPTS